jgi:4-diphosphocytidyl-2-C-methyl-D-erythritol kinase
MFSTVCPAKLNWWLHLLAPRPDGFTELSSLVVHLSVGDTLTLALKPATMPQTTLICTDKSLQTSDNLVLKAVNAWLAHPANQGFVPLWWSFSLDKQLPYQAGLGGGSSNAAGALRLCQQAAVANGWPPLPETELLALAATLGSDVPVFLSPTPVTLMQGRGELLTPYPQAQWPAEVWLLLVKDAEIACPTPWAYGLVRQANAYRGATVPTPHPPLSTPADWLACVGNDFQPVVMAALPALAELQTLLQQHTLANTLVLSGSGSALAAVIMQPTTAEQRQAIGQRLQLRLRQAYPNAERNRFWVRWAQPLTS